MLLSAQVTQAVKLPDEAMLAEAAKTVTVSTGSIIGMFVSLAIFAAIFVLACYFAYKYRGNAGGALMAFILGFVAIIVCSSGGDALSALLRVDKLRISDEFSKYYTGYLIYGLLGALVEFGFRYYLLYYMDKTGIGKHKAISVSCGFVAGTAGLRVVQMLSSALAALSINKGNFIPQTAYENADTLEQYIYSRDSLAAVPIIQYPALICTVVAFCALHVFLTLYMTRGWLEENKLKSSLIAAGITAGVAVGFQAINGLSLEKNQMLSVETALLVSTVFYLIVIVAAVFFTVKTLKNYPHGREKFVKSAAKVQAEAEARKKQSTWAQVNAINARNIVADTDDDKSEESPETSDADAEEKPETSDGSEN